jgi:type III secretion protein V
MAKWFDVPWASHELLRARVRMNRISGLPLPRVRAFVDEDLAGETYVAYVYDLATGAVSIPGGCYARRGAVAEEPGSMRADIPCLGPIVWVPSEQVADPTEPRWWNVYRTISEHLEAVAMAHAERLLGLEETHQMVMRMERDMPELAREAIKASPLPRTSEVLRSLAREGVSMRNMRGILESLVNWAGRERDNDLLVELVRVDLGAVITQRFVDERGVFRPLTVAPDFETTLVGMVVASPKGPMLAPPPEMRQTLHAVLADELARCAPDGRAVPVLCSSELRRHLATYLSLQFPQVRVFAYDELDRRLSVEPIGVLAPNR